MTVSCQTTVTEDPTKTQRAPWRALFLSWAWLRRAETIAEVLGVPNHSVQYLYRGTPFLLTLWKYLLQAVHSFWLCISRRPRVVFVTNPPVFAIVPVYLYALVFRARFVIDFHTGCFLPGAWKRWEKWQRFFARRAALNLAHNSENAKILEAWGVRHTVLPSLPPHLDKPDAVPAFDKPTAVYICSFKDDEPVEAFLAAAERMPEMQFRVTGRAPDAIREGLPENVELTGYLSNEDYLALLAGCDVLVALTTRTDSLLYGAQEGIALHKAMVLSDTEVLRSYFPKGTVFADNTAAGLESALRRAFAEKAALVESVCEFEIAYREEGRQRLEAIRAQLEG